MSRFTKHQIVAVLINDQPYIGKIITVEPNASKTNDCVVELSTLKGNPAKILIQEYYVTEDLQNAILAESAETVVRRYAKANIYMSSNEMHQQETTWHASQGCKDAQYVLSVAHENLDQRVFWFYKLHDGIGFTPYSTDFQYYLGLLKKAFKAGKGYGLITDESEQKDYDKLYMAHFSKHKQPKILAMYLSGKKHPDLYDN